MPLTKGLRIFFYLITFLPVHWTVNFREDLKTSSLLREYKDTVNINTIIN